MLEHETDTEERETEHGCVAGSRDVTNNSPSHTRRTPPPLDALINQILDVAMHKGGGKRAQSLAALMSLLMIQKIQLTRRRHGVARRMCLDR
jgi:hypothetical protein